MKPDQPGIYYATGTSRKSIEASPHIEALKARGYEILVMTDPVDPFAVSGLEEYEGKPLISAMTADLKLPPADAASEAKNAGAPRADSKVLERFQEVLAEHVSEVRVSTRLTDSPVCLVLPEGGLAPHIERLLRLRNTEMPASKRILELNMAHPLIVAMDRLASDEQQRERVDGWINVLYDQALLSEGSPIEDPSQFVRRISELLTAQAEAQR
jgi:molecular chaperone HtpG